MKIGLHATVLIAINNLRDIRGDKLADKKTLPVRFGLRFARTEIAFLCFAPFLLSIYWWWRADLWLAALIPWLALPLAIKIVRQIFVTEPSPLYNKFLAQSAGLHLLFGIFTTIGILLS